MKLELKKLLFLSMVAVMSATGFSSCSDDDDDEGGSGSGSCSAYVTGDGKTTKFNYGYVLYDYDEDYDMTWGSIEMVDTDIIYYYNHPSAINSSQKVSTLYVDYVVDGTGKSISDDSFTGYDFECAIGMPILGFLGDDDDFTMETGYCTWDDCDPIKFHKSGNKFTIEANNISAKACYDDDGWSYNSPDVTISFGISGTPTEVSWEDDWDDYSTRSNGDGIQWKVVTDPEEKAFLKKMRERIRSRKK